MQSNRREILTHLSRGPISGPALAEALGISRAAVWKHIETLRAHGFEIESGPDGYAVTELPEFGGDAVQYELDVPYTVVYREEADSTNDIARELAGDGAENVVVLAGAQPGGRGRLGRDWAGPPGGIYMSILLRPSLPPARVPLLTLAGAVAVTRAVAAVGVEATIKWPNDVLSDGRKLSGILTEMEGELDAVNWVIVGIGLNANVPRSDLPENATSLQMLRDEPVVRREVVTAIVEQFHRYRSSPDEILDDWRELADTLGRRVRVETQTGHVEGIARDVSESGSLIVETADEAVHVHSGDCEHLRPVDGG